MPYLLAVVSNGILKPPLEYHSSFIHSLPFNNTLIPDWSSQMAIPNIVISEACQIAKLKESKAGDRIGY